MQKRLIFLCLIKSLFLSQLTFAGKLESTSYTLDRDDESSIIFYLKKQPSSAENLLLLIQGSDCNSVYHNNIINEVFSASLNDKDVLTIEKYGIDKNLSWNTSSERNDCPQDYINNDSPSQRVKDIKQVLKHVMASKQYKKLVVLGGSEGALVANMLSAQFEKVTHTIAINGGGRWFLDDVIYNIEQTTTDENYESQKQGFLGFTQHLLNTPKFDLTMSGHGYRWWREMLEIDQTEAIRQIDNPIFIIQTEDDLNVSPKLALQQAQFLMATKSNILYKAYPNLDHGFKRASGVSEAHSVVVDIQAWLN
ncbi:alpha/beta hydrolase family protein [Marinomonas sp. PE14-40]|uniref:alpha/beta hydrolase family protein n=1 Tax=Marinomonas sp. PE14-40 TaxID=3060621 RepID=UPI003F68033F